MFAPDKVCRAEFCWIGSSQNRSLCGRAITRGSVIVYLYTVNTQLFGVMECVLPVLDTKKAS